MADAHKEIADLYKVGKLKKTPGTESTTNPPPWLGAPPALSVYRDRGHRRLDAGTFRRKCTTCVWGCEMPVEMIIDQWNLSNVRSRRETFCYGPKSCTLYRAGPTRKVPGRKEGRADCGVSAGPQGTSRYTGQCDVVLPRIAAATEPGTVLVEQAGPISGKQLDPMPVVHPGAAWEEGGSVSGALGALLGRPLGRLFRVNDEPAPRTFGLKPLANGFR